MPDQRLSLCRNGHEQGPQSRYQSTSECKQCTADRAKRYRERIRRERELLALLQNVIAQNAADFGRLIPGSNCL